MLAEHNSLKKKFLSYIIPSVVAQWVYTLYTMVDGMFVARGVSEIALTAVNIANPFIQTLFALSLMFAVGTSTVVAIAIGERRRRYASEVFTQNIVLLLGISAVIIAFAMWNLEGIARFLGAKDEQTVQYVVQYLRWIVPFTPFYILSYSFEILIKTDGFPRKATILVTAGAVANCILDWLFVIVLKKGVGGAAFATSISQGLVIALYLGHFMSGKGVLSFARFRLNLKLLGREVRNGLSSGLTELSSSVVTFAFNHIILAFLNQDALVGYTIVSYVNSIVVLSATGIAQGAQPLLGIYYGKKDLPACKKLLRYSIIAAGAFCAVVFAGCFVAADVIVGFYVRAELVQLRLQSVQIFRIFSVSFLLVGFNVVVSGYFTSVERAAAALAISVGRVALVLGCLVAIAGLLGGAYIWWTPVVSEGLCLALTAALLCRARRQKEVAG